MESSDKFIYPFADNFRWYTFVWFTAGASTRSKLTVEEHAKYGVIERLYAELLLAAYIGYFSVGIIINAARN